MTPRPEPTVEVDVLADGGVRVTAAGVKDGLASPRMAYAWVERAAAQGWTVTVRSRDGSTVAAELGADAERRGLSVTRVVGEPAAWPRSRSSLQVAAASGLVEQAADLVERGASWRAPRPWQLAPYRLAMRSGHVDVMHALRAAGVPDPIRERPPGAPDAVVLRPYVGRLFYAFAIAAAILVLVVAAVTTSLAVAGFGLIGVGAVVVIGAIADAAVGRTLVAVDGSQVYQRRQTRWRGPVDLRTLVAFGIREASTFNSATLLRLANTDDGEPVAARPWAFGGFDADIAERIAARPDVRVLTISTTAAYLRPGLERHIARHIDPARTMVSESARHLMDATAQPTTPDQ